MRTYYIFKLNKINSNKKEKDIYKLLSCIYTKKYGRSKSLNLIKEYLVPFEIEDINDLLNLLYCNNIYYTYRQDKHSYNDYYTNENTSFLVSYNYLKIKSSLNIPSFFYDLMEEENLFVCDFLNQDYFWLSKIRPKLLV